MELLSLERLKNIKLLDILSPKIVRFVWSAILDEKVCLLCRSLDGKVMDANSSEYNIYKSPIHPRCRCTQIPITSDSEIIPAVNFTKPKESWIIKYAPFWFLIPSKKREIIEEFPFAPESPNPLFNKDSILDIEDYMIENAKQKIQDMEQEMGNIYYIVFFLGSRGETILEKEAIQDTELDFTDREKKLIKEKASYYLISNGNDMVEQQIEIEFGLKKR